jgi:Kdo2-lipid IVA lauroyltransferase/acyltransferase
LRTVPEAAERRLRRKAKRGARRATSRRRAVVALKVVRALVRRLPMPVACALGHALGTLAYLVAGRARRQTKDHVALAFPDKSASDRARIARRSFALLGRGMLAFVVAHRMGAARALTRLDMHGGPPLAEALREGKGAIIVTFHYGAFEILASWLGTEFGGRAVGRESDEDGPTAMLIAMRRDLGCDTIQRGEAREILRSLRAGKPVAFLIDQDTDDVHGAFVPFFGRLAHTPLGPAALAVRTGAPVVMGFIAWDGLSRHRGWSPCTLRPRADLPPDEAAVELTARMTKIGEDEIRRRPDHWVWVHRRWETRPEEHPDWPVYPRPA